MNALTYYGLRDIRFEAIDHPARKSDCDALAQVSAGSKRVRLVRPRWL